MKPPLPGTPLLTIMDTSSVIARAHVPQNDAAALKPGDAATIAAAGGGRAQAKVTLISPALDPNSTTVEVWIEAANPNGDRVPARPSTYKWSRNSSNAVVVPASALLKTPEGETTVMIVKDNRAHQVSVETGIREGDRVQITKGLSGGETVIVSGAMVCPITRK